MYGTHMRVLYHICCCESHSCVNSLAISCEPSWHQSLVTCCVVILVINKVSTSTLLLPLVFLSPTLEAAPHPPPSLCCLLIFDCAVTGCWVLNFIIIVHFLLHIVLEVNRNTIHSSHDLLYPLILCPILHIYCYLKIKICVCSKWRESLSFNLILRISAQLDSTLNPQIFSWSR